jgi:O-antigen ligase
VVTLTAPPTARPGDGSGPPPDRVDRRNADASTPIVLYICLLFGLPSGLVFAPLGAAGSPAALLGIAFLGWWINARLVPGLGVHRGSQPIRIGLYAFQLSAAVSYLAGALRPLTSEEASSSTRGLLSVCAWSGIVLVTADGLTGRAALDRVLGSLVRAGVFLAGLGIVQFFFGWNPATLIRIPGLHPNTEFGATVARDSFTRVQGTAAHAIEFGVVLAMVLPLALHYAWFATEHKRRHWSGVLLIGFALPMTVSRSAIVGLIIVTAVMFAAGPARRRRHMLIAMPFLAVGLKMLVPGLLGTIQNLFVHISGDPSTQGRTDDYAAAGYYVAHSPYFGRGLSTFIPELYRTLDNAYLGWLLEAGVVGLLVLIGWMLSAILIALLVRARPTADARATDLGAALAAGLLSTAFNFATFDALGFAMCAGVFFLLLGATGALWRLTGRPEPEPTPGPALRRRDAVRQSVRRRVRYRSMLPVQCAGAALGAGLTLLPGVSQTTYEAPGSVLLQGPGQGDGANPYAWSPYLDLPSQIAQRLVMSPSTAADLRAHGFGADYTVASGVGSLMPWTDRTGAGPLIRVRVRAATASAAATDRDAVIRELRFRFAETQMAAGSPPTELIRISVTTAPGPAELTGNRKHALVTGAALGFAGGGIGAHLLGRMRRRRARSTGA